MADVLSSFSVEETLGRHIVSDTVAIIGLEGELQVRHLLQQIRAWGVEIAPVHSLTVDWLLRVKVEHVLLIFFPRGLWHRNMRVARVDQGLLVGPDHVIVEASLVDLDLPRPIANSVDPLLLVAGSEKLFVVSTKAHFTGILG